MRILLLAYYFPPCGGAAVQRWLRFIHALSAKQHNITVITTLDGDYPHIDHSLMDKIPFSVKVLRCKPWSFSKLWKSLGQDKLPYGSLKQDSKSSLLTRILYWLRLNLVVPDMRIGWNPGAYKLAVKELQSNIYDYVITTGPPHSTHLIGLKLHKKLNVQWRTDFRDPMADIYYLKLTPPSKLTMFLHKYLEKKIISTAYANYIVSHSIANDLPEGNKIVLYNGYNPEDFKGIRYNRTDKFRIKYAGQLTAGQDISPLLEALKQLENLCDIQFSFIGTRDLPATTIPLHKVDFLPHAQALDELVNAELLVLIINDYEGNKGMLTTKLFEYLASRTPVLCLASPGGEAEEIINQCQAGVTLCNSPQIAQHIVKLHSAWVNVEETRCKGDISFLDVNEQINCLLLH